MIARPKLSAAACIAFWLVAEAAAVNTFVEDRREQRDSSLPMFRSAGTPLSPSLIARPGELSDNRRGLRSAARQPWPPWMAILISDSILRE